jgi:hypothetical protein
VTCAARRRRVLCAQVARLNAVRAVQPQRRPTSIVPPGRRQRSVRPYPPLAADPSVEPGHPYRRCKGFSLNMLPLSLNRLAAGTDALELLDSTGSSPDARAGLALHGLVREPPAPALIKVADALRRRNAETGNVARRWERTSHRGFGSSNARAAPAPGCIYLKAIVTCRSPARKSHLTSERWSGHPCHAGDSP